MGLVRGETNDRTKKNSSENIFEAAWGDKMLGLKFQLDSRPREGNCCGAGDIFETLSADHEV
jgi:hypothetical protein